VSFQSRQRWPGRLLEKQSGQALLEWLLVATLALLMAIWGSQKWAARAEQAALEGTGQWLLVLSQAMQKALEVDVEGSESVKKMLAQKPPATVEAWQQVLKASGFLVPAFVAQPPLPFDVQVHHLNTDRDCVSSICPTVSVLLLIPPEDWTESRRQNAAPDLMLGLKGQGLAVTALKPNRLQGSGFAIDSDWPLGTVGVLVWRSEVLPPYVRLHEDRPVHFSGGLTVDGSVAVHGRLAVSEGVLLGDSASLDVACAQDGLLLRSPSEGLLMCRKGRWRLVQPPNQRTTTACLSRKNQHASLLAWRREMLAPLFPRADQIPCKCPSQYLPRPVWQKSGVINGVPITNGYICEKG